MFLFILLRENSENSIKLASRGNNSASAGGGQQRNANNGNNGRGGGGGGAAAGEGAAEWNLEVRVCFLYSIQTRPILDLDFSFLQS